MVTLRLYLEDIQDDWFGWIETFPGAYCQGSTSQEAENAASNAFVSYLSWLRNHGETLDPSLAELTSADVHAEIVETHQAHQDRAGHDVNAFFVPDERPVDEEDLARYLCLLAYSRADLVKAVHDLPPDQWDVAPFGEKSVRALLKHLADTEQFYLDRLHVPTMPPPHSTPLEQLEAVREEFAQKISALPEEKRSLITIVDGERWSLRKALRRALWHERYHTAQIAARSHPFEFARAVVHTAVPQSVSYGTTDAHR